MSVSFESAVSSLIMMFPEWDEETLTTLLMSNNYHVERTIETILAMSGDNDVTLNEPPPTERPLVSPAPIVHGQPVGRQAVVAPILRNDGPTPQGSVNHYNAGRGTVRNQPESSRAIPAPTSSAQANLNSRGRHCELPDDFLRPPGWKVNIIADEELALMLQNELFRNEVRAAFGEDAIPDAARRFPSNNNTGRPVAQSNVPSRPGGYPQQQQSVSRANSSSAPATQSNVDLGILKAISSMGDAAKRNLSMLAERFSQRGDTTGIHNARNEVGQPREFKPLVGDDDEDEEDVVSFTTQDRSRSRHVLNETGVEMHSMVNGHDNYDGDGQAQNPLLQQQSTPQRRLSGARDV